MVSLLLIGAAMRRWSCLLLLLPLLVLVPVGIVSCDDRRTVSKPPAPPNDLPIVERVNKARKEYQDALEELRTHYLKQSDVERQKWVEDELMSYHRISKRAYRLDLDVPPPTLKPEYNIPEANELFRKAMGYKGKGFMSTAEDNLRRAEILFQQLLSDYPQSDKIDDTAYELGTIYESRTFKQYRRAASYYERCFQWNPNTSTDARFKAAELYDKQLMDRGRAVQLYREVSTHDADQGRVERAKRRLTQLSSPPP
jgi:tetratricopeptide (TPR) repeat protein